MADYWKSTPRYWCKHCSMYVVDTKVSRSNHEATGKHQSAVKRALRDLHRDHERQEREKERAKREVDRLNGIVGEAGASASSRPAFRKVAAPPPAPPQSQAQQGPPAVAREQLEQLVDLGVSIPDQFRGGLALAGDWTVTETRIIEDVAEANGRPGGSARAVGVRKRPRGGAGDDDDDIAVGGNADHDKLDVDAAVQGLFKKPRTWGRDSRTAPGGTADSDLDSLLSNVLKPKKEEEDVKEEDTEQSTSVKQEDVEKEDVKQDVKQEDEQDVKKEDIETSADTLVKREDLGGLDLPPEPDAKPTEPAEPVVVFKKRKSKSSRQK